MNKFKSFLLIILLLQCFGLSCTIIPGKTIFNYKDVMIEGYVEYPQLQQNKGTSPKKIEEFGIKADPVDIAADATVTLLYPSDYNDPELKNVTIATGITDSKGYFFINKVSGFFPVAGDLFILEAIKRTNNNITLRTILRYNGNNFDSITTPKIVINTETTALSLISSLRPDVLNTVDTIGKFNVVDNKVEISDINTNVTTETVTQINKLVEQSIAANYDPVAVISYQQDKFRININGKAALLVGCSGDCSHTPDLVINPVPIPVIETTPVPPDFPNLTDNRIVFYAFDSEYHYNIYSTKADGTGLLKLTSGNEDTEPIVFDDGKKIAYKSSYYQLSFMNSDGTNQQQSVSSDSWYSIQYGVGKNGETYCNINYQDYGSMSSVCDKDGNSLYRFTTFYLFYKISPDGTKVLALRYDGQLELIDILNGDRRIIISDPKFSPDYYGYSYNKFFINWTRDGSKAMMIFENYPVADVYIIKADGTSVKKLTLPDTNLTQNLYEADWSPDNKKIVFTTYSPVNGTYALAVMKEDTSDVKVLATQAISNVNNQRGLFKPKWSIDGKTIMYYSFEINQDTLNLISPDGKYRKDMMNVAGADWIEGE